MRIGVTRETEPGETRVAATPKTVEQLRKLGYEVVVEAGAGARADFTDVAYREAGATVDGRVGRGRLAGRCGVQGERTERGGDRPPGRRVHAGRSVEPGVEAGAGRAAGGPPGHGAGRGRCPAHLPGAVARRAELDDRARDRRERHRQPGRRRGPRLTTRRDAGAAGLGRQERHRLQTVDGRWFTRACRTRCSSATTPECSSATPRSGSKTSCAPSRRRTLLIDVRTFSLVARWRGQ